MHSCINKQMEYPKHMGLKIVYNKFGLGHMGIGEL